MKKILFMMAAVMVLASCGSKKAAKPASATSAFAQEEEVIVPCSEYKSDKKALRASGTAISPNMQNAKDKAVMNARRELATSAQAFMKRVTETYASSYDVDQRADFGSRYQDMARQVAAKLMQGSVICCDKLTKTTGADGSLMYHSYVAVEINKDDLYNDFSQSFSSQVSAAEKAAIDFDAEKFRAIFDEEFGK